jgi:molybdopterin synthase sulfur carrier subunit
MKVELRLYASLARYTPVQRPDGQPEMAEVAEGTTIRGLLEGLKIPLGAIKVIFLNGIHAKLEEVLEEGDRVGVFPPVAGG